MTKYDAVFLKHFAQLIVGLMAFAGLLILLALKANNDFYGYNAANSSTPLEDLPPMQRERAAARRAAVEARLGAVGSVNAGETGRAALVAAEEARQKALAGQVAYGGTLDGAVIYQNLCSACHTAGVAGAPTLTAAAWAPRIAQGMDLLVKHATDGFTGAVGVMPAKGGNPALSDEQVRATVSYMVDSAK